MKNVKSNRAALRRAIQVALAGSVLASGITQAELKAHGPVAANGYPTWYQDQSGLALDFCQNTNQLELDGGWCLLLAPDLPLGVAPETFPSNFPDEHFYWHGSVADNTTVVDGNGNNLDIRIGLVMGVEGAFATGPVVNGDQMVFSRVRITMNPVPFAGDYVVYTPFGRFPFPGLAAGERLFNTVDIGLTPLDFEQALHGNIGPFLLPSATPGGAELPPIPLLEGGQDPYYDLLVNAGGGATPYPANGRKYIADPARIGPVTGATCDAVNDTAHCRLATAQDAIDAQLANVAGIVEGKPAWIVNDPVFALRNPNVYRIEGPGFVYESADHFDLMGRINEDAIAGRVNVIRASYTAANPAPGLPQTSDISVFVDATAATQGRIPAGPVPAAVPPQLSLFTAPCDKNPDTGAFIAPAGLGGVQMLSEGQRQFVKLSEVAGIPDGVCVKQLGVNTNGNTNFSYYSADLTDQVLISEALYDPSTQQMKVTAASSDSTRDVTLAVGGFGQINIPAGTTSPVSLIASTLAPPANINVSSITLGGSNVAQVNTGVVVGTPVLPVAFNDAAATSEDTPLVGFDVLANDSNASGGTVSVNAQPAKGTVSVNADQTITYTPNLNTNGTDSFTYSVNKGGNVSNTATVLVEVTPVNDLPVANNDNGGSVRGIVNTINLLANDTDPDGAADLAGGEIVTGNANLGIAAGPFNGAVLSFTPPATTPAGTYSFTYRARDTAGALSANTANVNITVATTDAPSIVRALFTQKTFRWQIDGAVGTSAGQSISVRYNTGAWHSPAVGTACTLANRVSADNDLLSTAAVDAAGNWVYDQILSPTTGFKNPTNAGTNANYWCTRPTQIRVISSLTGATANLAINLK